MHKRNALKKILKFTLKQLLHVSVQSSSSGSVLFELAKIMVIEISKIVLTTDGDCSETCGSCFNVNCNIPFKAFLLCISWKIKHFNIIKIHDTTVKILNTVSGPFGCPETSARNYHYTQRNIPEAPSSHLFRGPSLKSRIGTESIAEGGTSAVARVWGTPNSMWDTKSLLKKNQSKRRWWMWGKSVGRVNVRY
jgi:hypothetical protein